MTMYNTNPGALKIAETFTSIQGEGHLTGKRMHFIRFGGCTVTECPLHPSHGGLCDENWRTKSKIDNEHGYQMTVNSAFDAVGRGGWVCITGGEPADQPEALAYLAADIRRRGMKLNIQTSGTRAITAQWDWLTVSPKCKPEELKQTFGNELKLVYLDYGMDELREFYDSTKFWNYQLQPLWDGDICLNMDDTIAATHEANRNGMRWELSMQAHKFMGVK